MKFIPDMVAPFSNFNLGVIINEKPIRLLRPKL